MSTAQYKQALTNFRRMAFARPLKKILNEGTGKKVQATESLMAKAPTPQGTEKIIESMSEEQKALNKIYDMQKVLSNISPDEIKEYEVRAGDTVSDVLERTGMSMGEFLALNEDTSNISSEGELYAGESLKVLERKDEVA
tara:strand:- start:940 stop:1359 length:420 start_codon:yes stop_codon:yes gene_type:complete